MSRGVLPFIFHNGDEIRHRSESDGNEIESKDNEAFRDETGLSPQRSKTQSPFVEVKNHSADPQSHVDAIHVVIQPDGSATAAMREVADEELLSRNVSGCPLCRFSLEREEEETDVRIIGGQRAVGNIETPLYQRNEHASPGTAQRRRNRISGIPETHVCDFVTQKYLTPFDERTLDFVSPSLSCPWSTRVEPFSATSPLRNLDGLHVEALLDKPAYHPGDLVRGIIKLYVNKAEDIQTPFFTTLEIAVKGKEHWDWRRDSITFSPPFTHTKAGQSLFFQKIISFNLRGGERSDDTGRGLRAGNLASVVTTEMEFSTAISEESSPNPSSQPGQSASAVFSSRPIGELPNGFEELVSTTTSSGDEGDEVVYDRLTIAAESVEPPSGLLRKREGDIEEPVVVGTRLSRATYRHVLPAGEQRVTGDGALFSTGVYRCGFFFRLPSVLPPSFNDDKRQFARLYGSKLGVSLEGRAPKPAEKENKDKVGSSLTGQQHIGAPEEDNRTEKASNESAKLYDRKTDDNEKQKFHLPQGQRDAHNEYERWYGKRKWFKPYRSNITSIQYNLSVSLKASTQFDVERRFPTEVSSEKFPFCLHLKQPKERRQALAIGKTLHDLFHSSLSPASSPSSSSSDGGELCGSTLFFPAVSMPPPSLGSFRLRSAIVEIDEATIAKCQQQKHRSSERRRSLEGRESSRAVGTLFEGRGGRVQEAVARNGDRRRSLLEIVRAALRKTKSSEAQRGLNQTSQSDATRPRRRNTRSQAPQSAVVQTLRGNFVSSEFSREGRLLLLRCIAFDFGSMSSLLLGSSSVDSSKKFLHFELEKHNLSLVGLLVNPFIVPDCPTALYLRVRNDSKRRSFRHLSLRLESSNFLAATPFREHRLEDHRILDWLKFPFELAPQQTRTVRLLYTLPSHQIRHEAPTLNTAPTIEVKHSLDLCMQKARGSDVEVKIPVFLLHTDS